MRWLSRQFTATENYYDTITSDIQRPHGILHGILADNRIKKEELEELYERIMEREQLNECAPSDEFV